MAKKTRNTINTLINQVMDQIEIGSISPAEVKEILADLKDSYLNLSDELSLVGLRQYDANRSEDYIAGEASLAEGALWVNRAGIQSQPSEGNWLQLLKKHVLFDLPQVNTSTNYAAGDLVRFQFQAFEKINPGFVADVNDVNDPSKFNKLPMGVGYYGEQHIQDSIYKPGMVVSATIDGRKVILERTAALAKSGELKFEWNNGQWRWLSGSGSLVVNNNDLLENSHTGATLHNNQPINLVAEDTIVDDDFHCEIHAIDGTTITLIASAGPINTATGLTVQAGGTAKLKKFSNGFHAYGNLS